MCMMKTTIYLPQDLKEAVTGEATRRGMSEAEVIREAIRQLVGEQELPAPNGALFSSGQSIADHLDDYLVGFGQ